jgi:ankyrin repeat protein
MCGLNHVRLHMAPQVWRDAEELLRYLAANWPFDPHAPFEAKSIPVNATLPEGDTPLHLVAAWDDVRGIELLMRAGAAVDARGDMSYTPLATAVTAGNVAAARALLAHGASPHVKSDFGHTPYEMASRNGSEEIKEAFSGGAI